MAALQKTSTFNSSLFPAKCTVVIGLSGGPDSVYLLHKLLDLKENKGLSLYAAHLDHQWRNSSKNDVAFCAMLCMQYKIPFISKKASELQKTFTYNGSQEEVGRAMRRFFLEQVAQEYNAHSIALAHHQDDQIETFFINLIRGSSIPGLGGIKEVDGPYVRPLLTTTKKEILEYLEEHDLPYVTDPTNTSSDYLRNRIRLTGIPALIGCDARTPKSIVKAMEHLQETEQFLEKLTIQALVIVCNVQEESPYTLDLTAFFLLDPYLQKRVLKKWLALQIANARCSTAYFNEILRFLASNRGGRHQIDPDYVLIKKQGNAWIASP